MKKTTIYSLAHAIMRAAADFLQVRDFNVYNSLFSQSRYLKALEKKVVPCNVNDINM
jgi:hypothetical protein